MASSTLSKVKTFASLVKFEHTIFALPFAYTGALLGARGLPSWSQFLWITLAMVGARTAAMALNRLIDANIDGRNPRTAGRDIPAGRVGRGEAVGLTVAALLLLTIAAVKLNPLAVCLLPLAVLSLVIYSYTKRFTWACHLVLGAAMFWAPFGGWVAVSGRIEVGALLLGLVHGLWVAGFDVIYATQDTEFDRLEGIHSIPAHFGIKRALQTAKLLHQVVVFLLLALGWILPLTTLWPYLVGWLAVAVLLHYEHSLLAPQDLSRLNAAFFNVNGWISVIYFAFVALAMLI